MTPPEEPASVRKFRRKSQPTRLCSSSLVRRNIGFLFAEMREQPASEYFNRMQEQVRPPLCRCCECCLCLLHPITHRQMPGCRVRKCSPGREERC